MKATTGRQQRRLRTQKTTTTTTTTGTTIWRPKIDLFQEMTGNGIRINSFKICPHTHTHTRDQRFWQSGI